MVVHVVERPEDALALLAKAKETFEIFETLPGSPYTEIFFTYVELLSQAGKFEETVKFIPQLKILKLSDAQKMQLRIIQLDIDRQTSSEFTSIIAEAESILTETDDSSVGASIWAMIADIYARQKEWEKALMAYLRMHQSTNILLLHPHFPAQREAAARQEAA